MVKKYHYRVVPDRYRRYVLRNFKKRNLRTPIAESQVVKDLMEGKTLLDLSEFAYTEAIRPYRALYNHFSTRGFRLRIHLFDEGDQDIYRGVLIWLESLYHLWQCGRCKSYAVTTGEIPYKRGCLAIRIKESFNYPRGAHIWKEKKLGNGL